MGPFSALPLAAVLVLVAAPAVAAPAVAAAGQPSGSIFVSTLPSAADVWIDGTYVGRSPVLAGALTPGKHSVTLSKTGWAFEELEVEVRADATALSTVALTEKPAKGFAPAGSYLLRGVPHGAKVFVDGAAVAGAGPAASAAATGTHRVVLVMPRGRTTRSFDVLPDTTTEVVLHEPAGAESRSAVVAPANDYLPPGVCFVEGKKVVVRYGGHVVIARLGDSDVRYDGTLVSYAGTPQSIGGKLYLPLELLERLRNEPEPSRTR